MDGARWSCSVVHGNDAVSCGPFAMLLMGNQFCRGMWGRSLCASWARTWGLGVDGAHCVLASVSLCVEVAREDTVPSRLVKWMLLWKASCRIISFQTMFIFLLARAPVLHLLVGPGASEDGRWVELAPNALIIFHLVLLLSSTSLCSCILMPAPYLQSLSAVMSSTFGLGVAVYQTCCCCHSGARA